MSKKTQLVLVETVSMFRMRYVVEVPVGTDDSGNDKSLWALDTVTMNEAQEFSQEHLDETIVSHRVVSKKEALALCDIDNDYTKSWSKDKKIETFFTPWKE
jgi:bifunctional ADP-heptose synthase (sugar kinase/adenylyltransferase)